MTVGGRSIDGQENPGRFPLLKKHKKKLFFVISYLSLASVLVIVGEIVLRLRGFNPWRPVDFTMQVDPGGKLYMKHPTLGYSHIPGRFKISRGTGYTYYITHLPNTLRITHPIDSYDYSRPKKEIWIFGCSYTHGAGLNDEETYPWLLQDRLSQYEVVNFGVSGYGTIHSLLQFREALKAKRPRVAVLAYAGFHDVRNTFIRTQRKEIAPYNKFGPLVQPYVRLDQESKLRYLDAEIVYTEFPLMRRMALVHFLEKKYNQLEQRLVRSHAVSQALVIEMARFAKNNEVTFIIAGITRDEETLAMQKFALNSGIATVDISVDLLLRGNTNLPHDGHPSASANKQYADKLAAFIGAMKIDSH